MSHFFFEHMKCAKLIHRGNKHCTSPSHGLFKTKTPSSKDPSHPSQPSHWYRFDISGYTAGPVLWRINFETCQHYCMLHQLPSTAPPEVDRLRSLLVPLRRR